MSLEKQIHQFLIEKGQTLALAESCTGGALASRFSSLADASKYFLGSLVTYSNRLKHELLKVEEKTLFANGAVSRSTAHEMWLGVMQLTDADYAIATTGVAGPLGGTAEKPVGTVYIAVGKRGEKPRILEERFEGSRREVIRQTCDKALEELSFQLKA
jgi:PncC family amidohydrolase